MSEYPEIVQKIHAEYNTASEVLLKEAKEIIASISFNSNKCKLLEESGLVSTPEYKALKSKAIQLEKEESICQMIEKYAVLYPNNKFITEDVVHTINKKYGLVIGDISKFIGFVPEKNLKDIIEFKKKHRSNYIYVQINKITNNTKYYKEEIVDIKEIIEIYCSSTLTLDFIKRELEEKYWFLRGETYTVDYTEFPTIAICAPPTDMGISARTFKNMQKKNMFDLFSKKTIKIEADPIVLFRVKEGYIIVTAWGDEASDPLVVNEKFN